MKTPSFSTWRRNFVRATTWNFKELKRKKASKNLIGSYRGLAVAWQSRERHRVACLFLTSTSRYDMLAQPLLKLAFSTVLFEIIGGNDTGI
jgi:hypothetical protein